MIFLFRIVRIHGLKTLHSLVKMRRRLNKYYIIVLLAVFSFSEYANDAEQTEVKTIREERNHIRKGNKLYEEKKYSEAEVEYRKAIQENKDSEIGLFNLGSDRKSVA